jgi:6-pyruvoyltetrahydropterin/6-carboxytetrahydropterin synthase
MWELTKSFRFEAAHALSHTTLGEVSQEIHGHSFRAEVTIRGVPDPVTGMVMDLGLPGGIGSGQRGHGRR